MASPHGTSTSITLHGTCLALGGRAVVLRGPSGAGKSDLAWRFLSSDATGAARLVADDQVKVMREGPKLVASAPAILAGLLEIRGLGLIHMPVVSRAELVLIVDLVSRESVSRIAERHYDEILGMPLPVLKLHAFEGTAAQKLALALDFIPDYGFPGDDGRIGGY